MPRPLPPYPTSLADAPIVGPLLVELDGRDRFANVLEPGAWTLDLLRARQAGTLTRQQLCSAQRFILDAIGPPDVSDKWAILAASDTLGRVNTAALTQPCLDGLIRHASTLHTLVFGHVIRDVTNLRMRIADRKIQLKSVCGAAGAAYGVFLDRVGDALAPSVG